MNVRKRSALVVAIVALAGVAALAAGSVYAITIEVPARGTFTSRHGKTELLRGIGKLTGQPTDAVVQKLLLEPGEGPNWHTHAGPVTVIVKSGKFTYVDDDCSETTYDAGQVFVDKGLRTRASRVQPRTRHDGGLGRLRHSDGSRADHSHLSGCVCGVITR